MLLFDCGEGTQFQLLRAGLKSPRIEAIFISHFHGDHFFGLPGLLSSLSLLQFPHQITLIGPTGLRRAIQCLTPIAPAAKGLSLAVKEVGPDTAHGVVYEELDFRVEACPLEHSSTCLGYRYQERQRPGNLDVGRAHELGVTDFRMFRALKAGRVVSGADGQLVRPEEVVGPPKAGASFAYVTDTRPCDGGRRLAKEADILYHEATFMEDRHDRAVQTGHSTAREAAEVAHDAGAKKLLLSHFSARYADVTELVSEAREVFKNTEAVEELKPYLLSPIERAATE